MTAKLCRNLRKTEDVTFFGRGKAGEGGSCVCLSGVCVVGGGEAENKYNLELSSLKDIR